MGKMLFIESCCSCRYYDNADIKNEKYYCTYDNDRRIPKTLDLSAETPKWCPLPDWDGINKWKKK